MVCIFETVACSEGWDVETKLRSQLLLPKKSPWPWARERIGGMKAYDARRHGRHVGCGFVRLSHIMRGGVLKRSCGPNGCSLRKALSLGRVEALKACGLFGFVRLSYIPGGGVGC